MFRRILNSRLARDDRGIALITVIGISSVLAILIIAGTAYAVGGAKSSRDTQSFDGALSAAYAGVEEYQSRLAADPSYWRFGNAASPFSTSTGSSISAPAAANPAFGVGATGTWATVAGSPADAPARFRYEVDNSKYSSSGIIRIRATGTVGDDTRSLVADLKQKGFLDFLYFTDYEITDPAVGDSRCVPAYEWATTSRPYCSTLQFASADELNGPVHSNDTLLICGSRFNGLVTTGNSGTPIYNKPNTSCANGRFAMGEPTYSPVVGMPSTNSELRAQYRTDLVDVQTPGCLYTGPTSITMTSNGKMRVKSPWTKFTNMNGTTGAVSTICGTPGTSGLGATNGQEISVPTNRVIFVQNVPASGANSATTSATGSVGNCKRPDGTSITNNGVGYPITNEQVPSTDSSDPSYGCRNGDVFVQGTLSGQLTIASENYVYVTADVKYNNSQSDMLGLVGQNAVWVWNPVRSNGNNLVSASDRRIDSAILSVAHTFQVQNYTLGSTRGDLIVNGAIAQKFRGAVGTGSVSGDSFNITTGYYKKYLYDTRFRYTAPPKFLSPVTTTYGVTVWIEVDAAFRSDGSVS